MADYELENIYGNDEAFGFVCSAMMSVFGDSPHLGPIPSDMRRNVYRPIFERICKEDIGLVVTVPQAAGTKDVFLGFAMGKVVKKKAGGNLRVLHAIYVKKKFRGMGIASRLAKEIGVEPDLPFYYTFKPKSSKGLFSKFPQGRFRPALIRRIENEQETQDSTLPSKYTRAWDST